MSKGSGMGQKRLGERMGKGMDKCDAGSHGKQCGKGKFVSKGKGINLANRKTLKNISRNNFESEQQPDD